MSNDDNNDGLKGRDNNEGFQDIFDLLKPKSNISKPRPNEFYNALSFLEQERKRLAKIDDLFSKKLKNLKQYPQSFKLIEKEKVKREGLRQELLEELRPSDSSFHLHLARIFDSALKKS